MSDASDSEHSPAHDLPPADDAGSSRSLSSDSSSSSNHQESSSNSDGVMVNRENGDSDEVVVSSEDTGREDMFMDAPEDLGADGRESSVGFGEQREGFGHEMHNDYMVDEMERLRFMLEKAVDEKDAAALEFKDEMDRAAKAISGVRDRMRGLVVGDQRLQDAASSSSLSSEASLHDVIHECSLLVENVIESDRLKDQEIAGLSVSRDVVDVYLQSVQGVGLEAQIKKDRFVIEVSDRILSSLTSLVYVEGLQDDSVTGRIAHVEKCMYGLIENYNWFLYETDLLRQQMVQVQPDLGEQADYGLVYAAAKSELLEFARKEFEFTEKFRHLVDENRELQEQLDKHNSVAETAHAELERMRAELEQERTRYSNTKEKLSLAVTKGKALVQQRDTLKQTLAEKTSELESCLAMLQEKSTALEAAEAIKEELVRSQISAASLQEMLSQRELVLDKLEETLSEYAAPEGSSPINVNERIRRLVDERNALKDVSQKFHKLADALLSIDLPDNFSLSDLDSRMTWLKESFDQAKAEIIVLQDEIARTKEAASDEIGRLTASLSTALMDKDYLKSDLDDTVKRFEQIVEKEHQVSSEKEQVLAMLVEASRISKEWISPYSSDPFLLVEQCIEKIKEQANSSLQSFEEKEVLLESMLMHLYTRDQEVALCKELLEEDMTERSEWDKLSSDLKKASSEVNMLKAERDNLKKDLEKVEEKSGVLREKLSMAVKKGKGLFQDRENLKQLIDAKSAEIEKLTLELQQQEAAVQDSRNEVSRLSAEVESIPKLEADLDALNDQKHQLEKGLMETTELLEMVMESIHNMCNFVISSGSASADPVGKVKWLEAHFSETHVEKAKLEKKFEGKKAEVEAFGSKLDEAYSNITSIEEALSVAQSKISQLTEANRDLEVGKASAEEQLQRVLEESHAKDNMFADADLAKASVLNTLSEAEASFALLRKEKEDEQLGRTAAEAELIKMKEEVGLLTGKLVETSASIMSLEGTVQHLQAVVDSLTEENNTTKSGKSEAEKELEMLKEEKNEWEYKLQDAFVTIKSLEEALSKAESNASALAIEIKAVEQEKVALSTKLTACMEESAGTQGVWQARSLELFSYIKDLELFVKDDTIFFSMRRSYGEKLESLKEMDLLFKSIRSQFSESGISNRPFTEEVSYIEKYLSVDHVNEISTESYASSVDSTDDDDIHLHARKIVDNLRKRHKTFLGNFESFSSFVDQFNAAVLEELRATRDKMKSTVQLVLSLKEDIKNLETDKLALENANTSLEDGISILLSACTDATHKLQLEAERHERELGSYSAEEADTVEIDESHKLIVAAEKLLSVSRKTAGVFEQFARSQNTLASMINDLHNVLDETKVASDKAMEERDLYWHKVLKLETDLEMLQSLCSEFQTKLEQYQGIELKLSSKEDEISSLRDTLSMKEQGAREALTWVSEVQNLLDKVDTGEITSEKPQMEDFVPQGSGHIRKLMHIADNFSKLQNQVHSLSHDKEELHRNLATQLHQVEHLQKLVEDGSTCKQELAETRNELFEIVAGLEGIIQEFGGADMIRSKSSAAPKDLVEALHKLVMGTIAESKALKSKVDILDSQLSESQKTQNELSSKVKALETSLEAMDTPLEMHGDQELASVKNELLDLVASLERIVVKLGGKVTGTGGEQRLFPTRELVQVLENLVLEKITESGNSKSRADELDLKLLASQKAVDELLSKIKVLEDSLQSRAAASDIIQERGIFEAPSLASTSEISEVEDVGSLVKPGMSSVPSAAHARTLRKGSTDHIAVDIESGRLITKNDKDDDKGHAFKALNTSGLIPVQGKVMADKVDGVWVSGNRMLMSRPRARLGLIAYWLILHVWLLGTIL